MTDKIASHDLSTVRRDYSQGVLVENDLPRDPMDLLRGWLQYALDKNIPDANAMSLATMDCEGYPTGRIVLLRDATMQGLHFFTNYLSAKGHEIAAQPKASVNFFWSVVERQIRVRGLLEKLSAQESDAYFASRPRDSQIGAWASPQSDVIPDRAFLDHQTVTMHQRFENDAAIPRPPHWGGYRLIPNQFEFWQGRPSRLHDRMRATYEKHAWVWQRLAP